MDRWKITKDQAGEIHVRYDSQSGTIKSREEAINLAKKVAQDEKTLLVIHDNDEATKTDYTNFLTIQEVQGRQENEVKLAKAELTVAKAIRQKRKKAYKEAQNERERAIAKRAYHLAKERVRKEKINLRNAKKKFSEVID